MYSKRLNYDHDDRVRIVQYIIENKAYTSLRGNTIWKEMEASRILNRTWQSMKQHFKTTIIHNLQYYAIPQIERENILKGYKDSSKAAVSNANKKKCVPVPRNEPNMDFSDEETSPNPELAQGMESDSLSDLSPDLSLPQKKSLLDKTAGTSSTKQIENKNNNSIIRNLIPGAGKTFKKQEIKCKSKSKMPNMFADNNSYHAQKNNSVQSRLSDIAVDKTIADTQTSDNVEAKNINLPSPYSPLKIVEDPPVEMIDLDTPAVSQKSDEENPLPVLANSTTPKGFSRREEQAMVEYFRNDLAFFKHVNDLEIYNLYKETTKNSRTSEELRDHFVQNIFPFLYQYGVEDRELYEIYTISGKNVAKSLKLKVQELDVQDLVASILFINKKMDIIELVCEGQSMFVLKDRVDEEDYDNRLLTIQQRCPNFTNDLVLWDTDKYNDLVKSYHHVKSLHAANSQLMMEYNLSDSSDCDDYHVVPVPLSLLVPEIEIKEEFDSLEVLLSETPNASQISSSISNNSAEIPIQPAISTVIIRESGSEVDVEINIKVEMDSEDFDAEANNSKNFENNSVDSRYLASATSQNERLNELLYQLGVAKVKVETPETADDTLGYSPEKSEKTPSEQ